MAEKKEIRKDRDSIHVLDDILEPYLLRFSSWKRKSHYSSDALACSRQLVWRWMGEEPSEPQEVGGMLKMEFGNKAEEILTDALEWAKGEGLIIGHDEQNKIYHEEDSLEYPIAAKRDYLVYMPGENEPMTIELKTSFGRGISFIQQKGEPKLDHIVQVFIYGRVSHDRGSNRVVYLGRDSGYRTEFGYRVLHGDDEDGGKEGVLLSSGKFVPIKFAKLIKKFEHIERCVKFGSLPWREYTLLIKNGEFRDNFQKDKVKYKSDWQCLYCEFKTKCWEGELPKYQSGDNLDYIAKETDSGRRKVRE
jgi:hypothetical protein